MHTLHYSGYSYGDTGWIANVSCYKSVNQPDSLTAFADSLKKVHLTWVDNAKDETAYVVERSLNDSLHYSLLANLPSNTSTYTDTVAPGNSYLFYRVRAYRDSTGSRYSNSVAVTTGDFYIMQNGSVNGCGTVFLDPGAFGNYNAYSNYTTTLVPSETGKAIRVVFSDFSTESCCDYLSVYDGPDTSSPLLGTYSGSTVPPALQSTATKGELTFVFTSDGSIAGPGWIANVSCVKVSDTATICSIDENYGNTVSSNITGTSYQWQQYKEGGFVNIYDDINISGSQALNLHVKNAGLAVIEKFRCVTNGNVSGEFVIIKGNRWRGLVNDNWNNALNWSCGKVPDATTDVLIEANAGNCPVINSDAECRSLKLLPGANVSVAKGFKLYIRH